jgi:hypothetical protein
MTKNESKTISNDFVCIFQILQFLSEIATTTETSMAVPGNP